MSLNGQFVMYGLWVWVWIGMDMGMGMDVVGNGQVFNRFLITQSTIRGFLTVFQNF